MSVDGWAGNVAAAVRTGLLVAAALSPSAAIAQDMMAGLLPPVAATPAVDDDRSRALGCMTAAIAYEAGTQSVEGQQAVAEVILNRLRSPLYPKTVCGVVFAGSDRVTGCQFSFTCDGSFARRLSARTLAAAQAVAQSVLDGAAPDRVSGATHYHADYVAPYWAPTLVRVTKIGAHIFYRAPGPGEVVLARAVAPSGEPAVAAMARFSGRAPAPRTAPVAARVFAPWGLPSLASATTPPGAS